MESIVTFSYPLLKCKFSLNRRGPRVYGSLQQLLETKRGLPSTIGTPDGDVIREDLRLSTKYTTVIDFDTEEWDPDTVEDGLRNLVPEGSSVEWPSCQKYDVIEYGPGGFFSEHQDKKHKKIHCGTLLIFPPAIDILQHTGGELIIDRGRFRFDSSKNTEWTFIAFHSELPHECKPVISGRRVVFKTELYSTKPVHSFREPTMYIDGSLAIRF